MSRSSVWGHARPARDYALCEPARQTLNRERQTYLAEPSVSPRRPCSLCLLAWSENSTWLSVFRDVLVPTCVASQYCACDRA